MICYLVFLLFMMIGYNIPDLQPLIINVRNFFFTICLMSAFRAIAAYDEREIKPLTIALVSCIVCFVCGALTF